MNKIMKYAMGLIAALVVMPMHVMAEEAGVSVEMFTVNNVWMMVATFLVFAMHLPYDRNRPHQSKKYVNTCLKTPVLLRLVF